MLSRRRVRPARARGQERAAPGPRGRRRSSSAGRVRTFVFFEARRCRRASLLAEGSERQRTPPVRGLRAGAPLARDARRACERVRMQAIEHQIEDVARKVTECRARQSRDSRQVRHGVRGEVVVVVVVGTVSAALEVSVAVVVKTVPSSPLAPLPHHGHASVRAFQLRASRGGQHSARRAQERVQSLIRFDGSLELRRARNGEEAILPQRVGAAFLRGRVPPLEELRELARSVRVVACGGQPRRQASGLVGFEIQSALVFAFPARRPAEGKGRHAELIRVATAASGLATWVWHRRDAASAVDRRSTARPPTRRVAQCVARLRVVFAKEAVHVTRDLLFEILGACHR